MSSLMISVGALTGASTIGAMNRMAALREMSSACTSKRARVGASSAAPPLSRQRRCRGMLSTNTMTATLLRGYAMLKIPSICHRCEAPIAEGEAYAGGGVVLMCIPCAIKRAKKRVEDVETILQEEHSELSALLALAPVAADPGQGG